MVDQPSFQTPINPYKFLHIAPNFDDSLIRPQIPSSSPVENGPCITKDIPLSTARKRSLRLFIPFEHINNNGGDKIPVILYFHGGGFILGSASNTIFHEFCTTLATKLHAFVISVDYRLAPESRLPAAYEDALEAVNWVRNQALDGNGEQLLRQFGDFSKCYLMGCSSGGNIAYHAGLHALGLDIEPVKIKGLILNQPFFGGAKRSESELRMMDDKVLPLAVSDLLWELSLPKGASRDHEYCNPMAGHLQHKIGLIDRYFVSVRRGDPLMDHQMEFVRMLEGNDGYVVGWFDDDEQGYHGMELFEPQKAEVLLVALRNFICSIENSVDVE